MSPEEHEAMSRADEEAPHGRPGAALAVALVFSLGVVGGLIFFAAYLVGAWHG